MVLAMTHEEVVADLLAERLRATASYPVSLPTANKMARRSSAPLALIRVREFTMKDIQSRCRLGGIRKQYRAHYQAYFNIFHRCGIEVIAVSEG